MNEVLGVKTFNGHGELFGEGAVLALEFKQCEPDNVLVEGGDSVKRPIYAKSRSDMKKSKMEMNGGTEQNGAEADLEGRVLKNAAARTSKKIQIVTRGKFHNEAIVAESEDSDRWGFSVRG